MRAALVWIIASAAKLHATGDIPQLVEKARSGTADAKENAAAALRNLTANAAKGFYPIVVPEFRGGIASPCLAATSQLELLPTRCCRYHEERHLGDTRTTYMRVCLPATSCNGMLAHMHLLRAVWQERTKPVAAQHKCLLVGNNS